MVHPLGGIDVSKKMMHMPMVKSFTHLQSSIFFIPNLSHFMNKLYGWELYDHIEILNVGFWLMNGKACLCMLMWTCMWNWCYFDLKLVNCGIMLFKQGNLKLKQGGYLLTFFAFEIWMLGCIVCVLDAPNWYLIACYMITFEYIQWNGETKRKCWTSPC